MRVIINGEVFDNVKFICNYSNDNKNLTLWLDKVSGWSGKSEFVNVPKEGIEKFEVEL